MTKNSQDYSQILEKNREKLAKIKAILADCDGTLVDSQKKLSAQTKKMIKRVEESELVLGLCTGRAHSAIKNYILPNFSKKTLHILEGGGQIAASDGQIKYEKKIDSELVKNICALASQLGGEFGFTVGDTAHYSQNFYDFIKGKDQWNQDMALIGDLKDWSTACLHLYNIDNQKITKVLKLLNKNELNVIAARADKMDTGSFTTTFDLTAPGVNKGTTAERWAELHGLSLTEEVMMFGDGYNDNSVMSKAALGVAMGNAVPKLKEVADFTISHVDDDGLSNFVNQFLDKRKSWGVD